MKKTVAIIFSVSLMMILSACSQKEESKNPNPVTDPGGYDANMLKTKNQAAKDITDATTQENENQTKALNNNNDNTMNASANGSGDNSELVKKYNTAILKTSLGNIEVKLDAANAPMAVGNFLKLSNAGFYDGVRFHRVIKGFMIQGGDPNSKDDTQKSAWGTGGPGYTFPDELKGTETYPQGTLAMANAGPNTNGSQFFIVTASPSAPLPPSYTVFGSVVSGMDVALKIENVPTEASDRPVTDVTISGVELLEK